MKIVSLSDGLGGTYRHVYSRFLERTPTLDCASYMDTMTFAANALSISSDF